MLETIRNYWRPLCAVVFVSVVMFDFILLPVYTEYKNNEVKMERALTIMKELDSDDAKVKVYQQLTQKQSWQPLTLQGGGMFYVAFGSILGVAAFTRGQEKREQIISDRVNRRGEKDNNIG